MKTEINNKNKIILWLIASTLAIFILLLLKISNNEKKQISFLVQEIENPTYSSSNTGTAAVLHAKREDDIFILDGYSAVRTEEENGNKQIDWIMKGKDVSYKINCEPYEIQNDLQITGIKETKKGFYCEIDLTKIKNGEYKSFLWIKENEVDYAFVDLEIDFYKNGSEMGILTPAPCNNILEEQDGELVFSMGESLDYDFIKGYYFVRGCAYIPEKDSQFTKLYLEITDAAGKIVTYPFKIRYSAWAEEHLGEQYAWFDSSVILSETQIPKTDISVRVIAVNNGIYVRQEEENYRYQEGKYTKEKEYE